MPRVVVLVAVVVFHKGKISAGLSGVKSADRDELATISSQPIRDFVFFVGDFKLLNTLLPLVGPQVCSRAGGVFASDGLSKIYLCLFVFDDVDNLIVGAEFIVRALVNDQ